MTGKLPENVAYFARALRAAGLPVGPGALVEAIEALGSGALGGRDDVYWALHAIFVKKHEDSPLYDQAFRLFWRRRNLIEKIMAQMQEGVEKPRPKTLFEVGEMVRVREGPFTDFNGNVEEVNYEKSRLRVSVTIFGRATPVELEFGQVEKV